MEVYFASDNLLAYGKNFLLWKSQFKLRFLLNWVQLTSLWRCIHGDPSGANRTSEIVEVLQNFVWNFKDFATGTPVRCRSWRPWDLRKSRKFLNLCEILSSDLRAVPWSCKGFFRMQFSFRIQLNQNSSKLSIQVNCYLDVSDSVGNFSTAKLRDVVNVSVQICDL